MARTSYRSSYPLRIGPPRIGPRRINLMKKGDGVVIATLRLIVVLMQMVVIGGHPHASDNHQSKHQAGDRFCVPRTLMRHSRYGTHHDNQSQSHCVAEPRIPRHQIEMPLAARHAPRFENRNQCHQKFDHECEPQYVWRHGPFYGTYYKKIPLYGKWMTSSGSFGFRVSAPTPPFEGRYAKPPSLSAHGSIVRASKTLSSSILLKPART